MDRRSGFLKINNEHKQTALVIIMLPRQFLKNNSNPMYLKHIILSLFLLCSTMIYAQQPLSNHKQRPESPAAYPYMHHSIINEARRPLYLPEVDGYTLLKCDFHLHTIYSDGSVWPVTRVQEAFREGLDAIAITDHLEFFHINKNDVNTMENYNRLYEIAKGTADALGILLIPGVEVTREVPAGHYNMLFVDDANQLTRYINPDNPRDTTTIVDVLSAGKEMGAFIFWNHPDYQNPNGAQWKPIQQKLFDMKLIMGIEIINTGLYTPLVHQWTDDKGLTKLANSDRHDSFRIRDGFNRSMTIVFSRDRSSEGIREALFAGRTVGYAHNYLYGKEELVKPIFENSLKTRVIRSTNRDIAVEIRNLSGLPFELEFVADQTLAPASYNDKFILYGNETIVVVLNKRNSTSQPNEVTVVVNNLHVKAGTPLKTSVKF